MNDDLIIGIVNNDLIITILVTVVILVIVFLIFREIICWYFKINERINLMKKQNDLLEVLVRKNKDSLPKSHDIINMDKDKQPEPNQPPISSKEEKFELPKNLKWNSQKPMADKRKGKSSATQKPFSSDKGPIEIIVSGPEKNPEVDNKVFMNGDLAPDGIYKLASGQYISVKDGVIDKISTS